MNGESGSQSTRRSLIVGALALLFIVSFGLTLALLGGGENTPVAQKSPTAGETSNVAEPSTVQGMTTSDTPTGGFQMSESRIFGSLDQMVATSELVATGTVTKVLPGRVIRDEATGSGESYPDPVGNEGTQPPPPPPEEVAEPGAYPTRFPQTMVRIDNTLKGAAPEQEVIPVETLELAYARPNLEWREPGERVLLFLERGRVPGETEPLYLPVNHSQSVYALRNRDLVATVRGSEVPVKGRVASLSMPQLRAEVKQSKARISRGEVTTLEPRGMDRRDTNANP